MLKYPSKDLIIDTNFLDDSPQTTKTQSSQLQQQLPIVHKMKINKMTAMVILQNILKTNLLKSKVNAFYSLKSISLIDRSKVTLSILAIPLSYTTYHNPRRQIQSDRMKAHEMHLYDRRKRIKSEEQDNRYRKAQVIRDIRQKLRLYKSSKFLPDKHKNPALMNKDALQYLHSLQIQLQHHRNRNKLASILVEGRKVAFIRKNNHFPDYLLEREKIKYVKHQLKNLRSELKQQFIINQLLQKSKIQKQVKHHCSSSPKHKNYSLQSYDCYKLLQEWDQLQQSDKDQRRRFVSQPAQICVIESSDAKKIYYQSTSMKQNSIRTANYEIKSYKDPQVIAKNIKMIKRQIVGDNDTSIYSLSSSSISAHRQNLLPTNSTTLESPILKCMQLSEDNANLIQESTFPKSSMDRWAESSGKEKQFHGTIIKNRCFGIHQQETNTLKDSQDSL